MQNIYFIYLDTDFFSFFPPFIRFLRPPHAHTHTAKGFACGKKLLLFNLIVAHFHACAVDKCLRKRNRMEGQITYSTFPKRVIYTHRSYKILNYIAAMFAFAHLGKYCAIKIFQSKYSHRCFNYSAASYSASRIISTFIYPPIHI